MSTKLTPDNGKVIKRVIHASDIHIRTGDLERSRYHEYQEIFKKFIDQVSLVSDSVIILTGDIFHNKGKIEPAGLWLAHQLLDQLLEYADVIFICGNHDYRQDDTDIPDMIESIYQNYFQNKVHSKHKAYYLNKTGSYQYYNINFGVVDIRDVLKNYNTSGKYEDIIAFPKPIDNYINIALYHGMGFELSWFDKYDYILLGDNHKFSYSLNPVTWGYAGSLIQQDFGESFYDHGFIIWNLENKTLKHIEIFNNYSYCTIKCHENNLYIHHRHKDWIPITDINPFPKFPSIRTFDEQSLLVIKEYCSTNDICPKYLQLYNSATKSDTPQETSLSHLDELNSTQKWVEYLKQFMTFNEDYIYHPELLKLPTIEESFDFIKKYQERNSKIQKAIDEYVSHVTKVHKLTPKVYLKNMEWAYLMCFGEHNTFDFSKLNNKIVLLNGKNAMGKSSFLDILCIGLYGEPTKMRHMITGKKYTDKIIHDKRPSHSTAPHVKILFTIENETYELYRSFGSQSAKEKENLLLQTAIQLYKINGQDKIIYLEGSTLVDKWVTENIGDMDSVLMSTMLCQIDLNNFFYLKQEEQKAILDKALQLDNVSLFGKILKESILAHQDIVQQIKTASLTLQNIKQLTLLSDEELSELNTKINQLNELKKIYSKHITKTVHDKVPDNIEELYKQYEIEYEMLENKNIDLEKYYTLKEKVNSLQKQYQEYKHIDIIEQCEELYNKWNKKFTKFLEKKPTTDVSMEWIKDSYDRYNKWCLDNTESYTYEDLEKYDIHPISKPHFPIKILTYRPSKVQNYLIDITEYKHLDDVNIEDIELKYNKYKEQLNTFNTKTKEYQDMSNIVNQIKLEHNSKCSACKCNQEYMNQLETYVINLNNYLEKYKQQITKWETKLNEYSKIIEIYPSYYYSVQHNNKQWEDYNNYIKYKGKYKKAQQYIHEKQNWDEFINKYSQIYEDYQIWSEEYTVISNKVDTYKKSLEKYKLNLSLTQLQEQYDAMKNSVEIFMNYDKYKNIYYSSKLKQIDDELKPLENTLVKYNVQKQHYDQQMILYNKLKNLEETLQDKLSIVKLFDTHFIGDKTQNDGYKEWIYKQQVIPMLNTKMNQFLSLFEEFKFEMIYHKKNFIYMLHDRGNKPTLDKASGYQNFIIGIALRITLSSIGAIGQQFKHLFIDEGFTACDYNNIQKVPQLLKNILTFGNYHSIILMSHLDSVRECSQVNINITRKDPFSYIQYGSYPEFKNSIQKKRANRSITSK